jgi:FkbM family methyltransferase
VIAHVEAALSQRLRRRYARRVRRRPELRLEKLGTAYGGWVIPTALVRPNWICYDGGVGEDASFALELISRFGCTVYAFDPTPRAIAFVRSQLAWEPRFKFMPVGLWSDDTTQRFWAPRDPSHVSHSIPNLQHTQDYFEAVCRSVASLMLELGHDHLDLFKVDVEGAEHDVIRALLDAGLRPGVLCTEIDRPVGPLRFWTTIRRIRAAGYSLVAVDDWNFTFVRADTLRALEVTP